MARKRPKISIEDIRNYTKRNNGEVGKWLTSVGGDYNNTFSLIGKNSVGQPTKVSIFNETNFDQPDSNDDNLFRFTLAMYCLRHKPYYFSEINKVLNYDTNDFLYTKEVQEHLKKFQIGKGSDPVTRSLTSDVVRTYRSSENVTDEINEKSTQSLINYSQKNPSYIPNIADALGKVTYNSIIKQTLYSLLVKNQIIPEIEKTVIWSEEANKLSSGKFDLYVDVSGGPYKRSFPVICAITKNTSGKSLSDLFDEAKKIVESKFFRSPTTKELVTVIENSNEKNFVEQSIRSSGDSVYCVIFDFSKVIVLNPTSEKDLTLDILKICLSLFSKKQLVFTSSEEFKTEYKKIRFYLEGVFPEEIEENNFSIALIEKHSKECEYELGKTQNSLKGKISNSFKAEIKNLAKSLELVYEKIINIFNEQTKAGTKQNFQFKNYFKDLEPPVILHFDNFYNLLAITSVNLNVQENKKNIDQTVPFVLEDYEVKFSSGNLAKLFFKDAATLPTFANTDYKFAPSIATEQDIALITDVLLRQIYENADSSGKGLVYENDKNENQDKVLSIPSINLFELIKTRTGYSEKLLRDDYFFTSSENLYLRKEVVKKLDLKDLLFSFESVREDKIKLQTLSHFFFVKRQINNTIDDFREKVYYPKLIEKISDTPKEETKTPPTPNPKKAPKNNNYLINNIISSELACYEDITNNFDRAINEEKPQDQAYYAFKALVNIGLPILLAYAAQEVANKLSKISKNKIDPSLLECLLQDSDNLKKMVIGALDLATSSNSEQLLLQFVPQIPRLPVIPFFQVFDLEKEIKRQIIKFIIQTIIKLLQKQLQISIQPIVDMCNSDSYLSAFLDTAFANKDDSNNKLAAPAPSGLTGGNLVTTDIPQIQVNINLLIDQTAIETRENVYQAFRNNYFVSEQNFPNEDISDFFDYLSNSIEASELVTLLKGSSSLQTRNVVLSYITNYKSLSGDPKKFVSIINDEQDIYYLFVLLSNYIDYRLILEVISRNLKNFSPSVCIDINSKFDDFSTEFSKESLEDQANDLENLLNDICSLKITPVVDILADGPNLLTTNLEKSLNTGFSSLVFSIEKNKKQIDVYPATKSVDPKTGVLVVDQTKFSTFKASVNIIDAGPQSSSFFGKDWAYYQAILAGPSTSAVIKDPITKSLLSGYTDLIESDNKISKQAIENQFGLKLKNAGNVGLKTDEKVFNDYITKYSEITKLVKEQKIQI